MKPNLLDIPLHCLAEKGVIHCGKLFSQQILIGCWELLSHCLLLRIGLLLRKGIVKYFCEGENEGVTEWQALLHAFCVSDVL